MSKINVIALKSKCPAQFCGHHVFVGCMIQIWLALVSLGHWEELDRAGCQHSPGWAQGTHNNASHHWLVQIPPDPRDKKQATPIQCPSTSNFVGSHSWKPVEHEVMTSSWFKLLKIKKWQSGFVDWPHLPAFGFIPHCKIRSGRHFLIWHVPPIFSVHYY